MNVASATTNNTNNASEQRIFPWNSFSKTIEWFAGVAIYTYIRSHRIGFLLKCQQIEDKAKLSFSLSSFLQSSKFHISLFGARYFRVWLTSRTVCLQWCVGSGTSPSSLTWHRNWFTCVPIVGIQLFKVFRVSGRHTRDAREKFFIPLRKLFWLGNETMRNLRQLLKLHISGRSTRCFPGPGLDWTRALCLCSVFHYKVLFRFAHLHWWPKEHLNFWLWCWDIDKFAYIVFLSSLPNFHFAHLALWSVLMKQTIEFSISLNTSRLHRTAIALPQQDYRRLMTLARLRLEFVRCLHAFMFHFPTWFHLDGSHQMNSHSRFAANDKNDIFVLLSYYSTVTRKSPRISFGLVSMCGRTKCGIEVVINMEI